MKVLVKWKKSIVFSLIILMGLAIFITIGRRTDEKSKLGYTLYQSEGAVTHIDKYDINVLSPKNYGRYFPDSSNSYVAREMNSVDMNFAVIAEDYSYIQEFYFLPELSETTEEGIRGRIESTQGNYRITSELKFDEVTFNGISYERVCYSRKDLAYLDFGVVAEYYTVHNGVCMEIRCYKEYEKEPDYNEIIIDVCSETEGYLSGYSFGATQSQPEEGNFLWEWWRSLNFAPWVLLVPFIYALLCGIIYTGRSEKVYVPEKKRYRFVGDVGTGWNEEFLSLDISKMLLGLFSVFVMYHHLVQKVGAGEAGMLSILEDFGVGFVAVFFFFSGYGLYESIKKKEGYLKGFLKKRLPTVLVPFYTVILVFVLYELLSGVKHDAVEVIAWISGWKLINPSMWYIVEIVFLYIIFFLLFRFIKKRRLAIALLFVCIIVMITISFLLVHGDAWFQGEWWYNTTLLFGVGVLFSEFKDDIVYFMKRFYKLLLPAVFILFIVFYKLTEYMLQTYSYWSEKGLDKGYDDKLRCLVVQCPMVFFFVMLLLLIGLKLKIGNKCLMYLGKISLEIYLIHNLFFSVFSDIKGTGAFFFSVTVSTLIAASVLHFIHRCIICLISRKPLPDVRVVKRIFPEYIEKKKAGFKDFSVRAKRSLNYGRHHKKTTRKLLFRYIVCIFLCLVSILPVVYLVVNATKSKFDLIHGVSFLPGGNFSENLRDVKGYMNTLGLDLYKVIGLSCLISFTCTFLGTYIGALCAYGFEFFSFKKREALWWVVIAALMMPAAAGSVGFFKLVSTLHLFNHILPIILAGITIPSCVYFLRMYLHTLKLKDIIEAARIDGYPELLIFIKIILPIMKPAILLQLIINFANSWNNTLYQNLVLIDAKKKTISVFLHSNTVGEGAGYDPFVYCLLLVSTIPSLILFIIFSHGIAARINLGSIKE